MKRTSSAGPSKTPHCSGLAELDLEHIAEEIEDMGRRDRREVRSGLTNLIAHLLKWAVSGRAQESELFTDDFPRAE